MTFMCIKLDLIKFLQPALTNSVHVQRSCRGSYSLKPSVTSINNHFTFNIKNIILSSKLSVLINSDVIFELRAPFLPGHHLTLDYDLDLLLKIDINFTSTETLHLQKMFVSK